MGGYQNEEMGDNFVIMNYKFFLMVFKLMVFCLLFYEYCLCVLNKFYRQVKNGVYGDDKCNCWFVVRVWDKFIVVVINKV